MDFFHNKKTKFTMESQNQHMEKEWTWYDINLGQT